MVFKKGVLTYLVVFIVLLVLFSNSLVFAEGTERQGYCANPNIIEERSSLFFCPVSEGLDKMVPESECCPAEGDPSYGEAGYPANYANCISDYFSEYQTEIQPLCDIKCCFLGGDKQYCEETQFTMCLAEEGEVSSFGTCGEASAASGDLIVECSVGCCCYESSDLNQGELGTAAYCADQVGIFNGSISNEQQCKDVCGEGQGTGTGNTGDSGDQDIVNECTDGENNDPNRDDYIDSEDPCCQVNGAVKEACADDFGVCPSDKERLTGLCNCNGQDCGEGSYCCDGSCLPYPCDTKCMHDFPCGQENAQGCPLYHLCQPDGSLTTDCVARDECMQNNEICTSPEDDNENGLINCEDVFCDGMICANSPSDTDNCVDKGFYDFVSGTYKCCSFFELNDCDDQPGYDTCGPCDCLKVRRAPILLPPSMQRGVKDINLKWSLNCPPVTFNLYSCVGERCSSGDYDLISPNMKANTYSHKGVSSQTKYCYYVNAVYPNSAGGNDFIKQSEIKCITTGHDVCMTVPYDNFCLDETAGFNEGLVFRAVCDKNNSLHIVEDCREKGEGNYFCMGPFEDQTTRCVFQAECAGCGNPFDVFSDYITSKTTVEHNQQEFCKNTQSCYYDGTNSSADIFSECYGVQSCHDYVSEKACTGQGGITSSNNKCLHRDCEWLEYESVDELDKGMCMETQDYFNKCDMCNDAEFNKVFGACNYERCMAFGDCFLRSDTMECVSKEQITCADYMDPENCNGGVNVSVDVEYDVGGLRVDGSHEILETSKDTIGLNLCKWDGHECFKDANDDNLADPSGGIYSYDMTPPTTLILTPPKTRVLNLSVQVTDYDLEGKPGSGVKGWNIFFCQTEHGEEPCYPTQNSVKGFVGQTGWMYLGGGIGRYDIYYYSMDNAHNLEKIKNYTLDIDLKRPEISIEYEIDPDTRSFTNSSILFYVETDEDAVCRDYFEGTNDYQLLNRSLNTKWQTQYGSLEDGFYEYKVVCTDVAGNVATKIVTPKVDADSFVFYTAPYGKLNYSEVPLIVRTSGKATCRWDIVDQNYNVLAHQFVSARKELQGVTFFEHTSTGSFVLDQGSKTYSLDVKCKVDASGRISDDEIQFVYDVEAPETKVIDAWSKELDLTRFYTIEDLSGKLFLDCNDEPENGFGCNRTLYCIDPDNNVCTPDQRIEYYESLKYNNSNKSRLCYQSVENIEGAMGGLWEEPTCVEIQVDAQLPILKDMNVASATFENPKVVHSKTFLLEGLVVDGDAINDFQSNKLRIVVEHSDLGGSTVYEDIDANSEFSQLIDLKLGLNTITLDAVDRSGANSGPYTYYIYYKIYEDDMISLRNPFYGVSESQIFTFEVDTFAKGDCKFSLIGDFNSALPMKFVTEGGSSFYHLRNSMNLGTAAKQPQDVTVYCKFDNSYWENRTFSLSWDNTPPEITEISIDRAANGRTPPTVAEFPVFTNLIVKSDDDIRCKFTNESSRNFHDDSQFKFPGYDDGIFNSTTTIELDENYIWDNDTFVYWVQCENKVGKLSPRKEFVFKVDTSLSAGLMLREPETPTSKTSFKIVVSSSKKAGWCTIKEKDKAVVQMTAQGDGYHFEYAPTNLSEGKYDYHFECLTSEGRIDDDFGITIDTSAPVVEYIDDGNYSNSLDSLYAKWKGKDSLTSIDLYKYTIGTAPGSSDVQGWKNTTSTSATVSNLNLTDKKKYYWTVKTMNEVGLWSDSKFSDGVTVDSSYEPGNELTEQEMCFDAIKNNRESDLDCGGESCPSCSTGKTCKVSSDCVSLNCKDFKCIAPTCIDSIKNQDESDIDCGGACDQCDINQTCKYDEDCMSGYCHLTRCAAPSCTDGVKNGNEEGVDCGGDCSEECTFYESNEKPGCTIMSGMDQGQEDSDCDKIPDSWEIQYELNAFSAADADEDPDEDDRTNYQEYIDGTNPKKYEKIGGGSNILFLILMIFGIIALLIAIAYLSYVQFYDQIPPKYRQMIDPYLTKIRNSFYDIKNKAFDIYNQSMMKLRETPLGKYLPAQTSSSQKAPVKLTQKPKKAIAQSKASAQQKKPMKISPKSQSVSGARKQGRGPLKIVVSDNEFNDAANTKELIDRIRKKRKEDKSEKREEFVSSFDTVKETTRKIQKKKAVAEDYDLKNKKKSLLNKVEDAFSEGEKSSKKKGKKE